jgi:ABC-type polar amino acid transport system ATPase subunit
MLRAENLTKSFGGERVLEDICIEVNPGKFTFLIGPSGAGKTTLLRCLAILEVPEKGKIQIDQHMYDFPSARGSGIHPPWPDLTVVFQQHFLWPHLTIRQNILLPLKEKSSSGGTSFAELVTLFDMERFIDRYPNEASLGERQRAALARALILNPRYILMDEITSSLDVEQVNHLFYHLLELRRRGIGILLITHQLEFARALLKGGNGDEAVFLDRGRILEKGGVGMLENPGNPRVRQFLGQLQYVP